MGFKLGDKVVCVDDSKHVNMREKHLKKGKVYTVLFVVSEGKEVMVDCTAPHFKWLNRRFRRPQKDSKSKFKSNSVSQELAEKARRELVEYNPQEIPKHLEEVEQH